MARPEVKGLKYFPFEVDFFNDEKIEAVSAEFGIKGEITAVKLLCAIYQNGYFIEWTDRCQMKLLRNLPGVSLPLLNDIVNRLVKWGFFDKALFDSAHILTSAGIQRRYFYSTRRRKKSGDHPYRIPIAASEASLPAESAASLLSLVPGASPPGLTAGTAPADPFSELRHPTQLRENICMRFDLTPEALEEKLSTFLLDCQCRETVHDSRRDAINHFNNWLRIVTDAEKRKETTAGKRRGVQTVAPGPEEYSQTF